MDAPSAEHVSTRTYAHRTFASVADLYNPPAPPPMPATLAEWCTQERMLLEGEPLDLTNRPWLKAIYDDLCEHIVLLKATQVGGSVWAIFRCVYLARTVPRWRGWGYFFPTKTDVNDFSQTRVRPIIQENPCLRDAMGSVDNVGVRQLGKGFIYFRGLISTVGTRSFPADGIVLDELDEAPEKMRKQALKRMGDSPYKYLLELSNPSLPNYGIDLAYSGSADGLQVGSDQRAWHVHCQACGHWQCLEAEFPQNVGQEDLRVLRPRDPTAELANQYLKGSWYRACVKCEAELDIRQGEWVAAKPSVVMPHGYRLSQLFSPNVDPAEIAKEYYTTRYPDVFYNLAIGIGWMHAQDRLEVVDITKWCSANAMRSTDPGPCTMGIDQGGDFHVVISRPTPFAQRQIVHIGEYRNRVDSDWQQLDDLMARFRVGRCVIDGMPSQNSARSFALRHAGKVFLNYYGEEVRGRALWNHDDFTVRENRTELLDASRALFRPAGGIAVILPRQDAKVEAFAAHVCALVRKREESDKGNVRYVYVHGAGTPDHWGHAWAYDCLCWAEDVAPARPIGSAAFDSAPLPAVRRDRVR